MSYAMLYVCRMLCCVLYVQCCMLYVMLCVVLCVVVETANKYFLLLSCLQPEVRSWTGPVYSRKRN
jgi:hypothetical protein